VDGSMDHKRLHGLVKRNPTMIGSTACGDAPLGATFASGTLTIVSSHCVVHQAPTIRANSITLLDANQLSLFSMRNCEVLHSAKRMLFATTRPTWSDDSRR
jgi:hypothetical protein